jgi:hypothetical protein
MRVFKIFFVLVALALGSAAMAGKDGSGKPKDTPGQAKSGDVVVNVDGPAARGAAKTLPIKEAGQVAYDAQESTLGPVGQATGTERYYVWVGVGGEYVPVDPMRVTETE